MADPPDPRSASLRGWAALVLACAGLVTAAGTALRKPPEDAARAGYLELTKAILDSQAAEKQNHEDLVALRAFLDAYTKGHEVVVAPVTPPLPSPPVDAGAAQLVHASAPASANPPPHVTPLPPPRLVRAFDSL